MDVSKIKTLISEGLRATGNFDDCLSYIEESLTFDEYEGVESFFNFLKKNNYTIGSGNFESRWNEWRSQSAGYRDFVKQIMSLKDGEERTFEYIYSISREGDKIVFSASFSREESMAGLIDLVEKVATLEDWI